MEYYEEFYYGYQVEGRGIADPASAAAAFKKRVREYDELFGGYLPEAGPALDLGCGYGNFLFYLREKGWADAAGVDLDVRQVEIAASLGLSASVGGALEAVGAARGLALISAFDLIEHLEKDDAVRLLLLAHKALRPQGVLLLQCPCMDGFAGAHDLGNDLTHRWAPSSNALGQMLRAAGFRDVRIIDMTLPPFPMSARARAKNLARRAARAAVGPLMQLLGVRVPAIWSNSQIALGVR